MPTAAYETKVPTAICTDLDAILDSMELSLSTWLISSLSPGNRKGCPSARCVAAMSPDC